MAKIKGLNKIDRIINEFTLQFDIKADLDTEFQAFCDTMTIGYALFFNEEDRMYFINDAEKRYPEIKADIFLWALMHEIGHCMTDDMWTEEEKAYFEEQKETIAWMPADTEEDEQLRNDFYHNVPDEFFATKWAGDYMREHPKKIAKFWNELQAAIMRMYRKNGVI